MFTKMIFQNNGCLGGKIIKRQKILLLKYIKIKMIA